MKITKRKLRRIINEEFENALELLREQDEEEEAEEAEDTAEEEEAGGETADEEAEDAGADEEAEDEAAEEEGEEEEEEEEGEEDLEAEITPGDEVQLGKSAGAQIDAYLLDFETKAIKSFEVERQTKEKEEDQVEDAVYGEWFRRPLSSLLFEQEEPEPDRKLPPIDMESFTADVARLIMNYDSLLDMEATIANKARSFLRNKYDQDHVDRFDELLDIRFDIDLEDAKSDRETPEHLAVGASGGDGGGGSL